MKFEKFSDLQNDFIIGSLLGDGHLEYKGRKTPRLTFAHGKDQEGYCKAKRELMKDYCKREVYHIISGKEKYDSYRFETRSVDHLKEYIVLSITDTLSMLNENSFCIWLLDDGCIHYKSGNKEDNNRKGAKYQISIARFTEEEAYYCLDILKEKFGFECYITRSNGAKRLNFGARYNQPIREMFETCGLGYIGIEHMSYKIIK